MLPGFPGVVDRFNVKVFDVELGYIDNTRTEHRVSPNLDAELSWELVEVVEFSDLFSLQSSMPVVWQIGKRTAAQTQTEFGI